MPDRRKFSKRSRSWNSQVVGTHNVRRKSAAQSLHDSSVYSSRRRVRNLEKKAGHIDQMEVETRSVDPSARLEERRSRAQQEQRTHRRKLGVFGLIIVALACALAFGLGNCVLRGSVSGAMALEDADVKNALSAPADDANAYYVLVVGMVDERTSGVDPLESDTPTAGQEASSIQVLRVEPEANKISLVSIPDTMYVNVDGVNGRNPLRALPKVGGEASLVRAVSDFMGVPINHYLRIDERGLIKLVDSINGVHLNVLQVVDDPSFSSIVIDAGEQTLDGKQTDVYVNASNYADAVTVRAEHQQQLLSGLFAAAAARGGFDYLGFSDEVSRAIKTDMNFDALEQLSDEIKGAEVFYKCIVSGSAGVDEGDNYFTPSSKEWPIMKQRFADGEDPTILVDTSGVDKAKIDLVVLNGSGVTGLANEVSERLTQAGYEVSETGNAASYVYDETLVIYRSSDDQLAAEAIVQDLGIGRAVSASVYYNLNSDVQVVVGKDWKPQE